MFDSDMVIEIVRTVENKRIRQGIEAVITVILTYEPNLTIYELHDKVVHIKYYEDTSLEDVQKILEEREAVS